MKKLQQMVENQTFEKSALIVSGTALISTGMAIAPNDKVTGLVLVGLGVFCLVVREVIKK